MTWVLIIMIWYSTDSAAVTTQEFDSENACLTARDAVQQAWGPKSSRLVCVLKGDGR